MPRPSLKSPRDTALRVAGALFLVIALRAAMVLGQDGHLPAFPSLFDVVIAVALFVTSSIGAALLLNGDHLLDEVALSDRWTRRND
jgi:hypothetical protein